MNESVKSGVVNLVSYREDGLRLSAPSLFKIAVDYLKVADDLINRLFHRFAHLINVSLASQKISLVDVSGVHNSESCCPSRDFKERQLKNTLKCLLGTFQLEGKIFALSKCIPDVNKPHARLHKDEINGLKASNFFLFCRSNAVALLFSYLPEDCNSTYQDRTRRDDRLRPAGGRTVFQPFFQRCWPRNYCQRQYGEQHHQCNCTHYCSGLIESFIVPGHSRLPLQGRIAQ